jgi:hypothetical protein
MTSVTGSRLQGRDDIVIDAPMQILRQVISDSNELPNWGPPVRSVEMVSHDDGAERLGSARKIQAEFGRKSGYFIERRAEHVEGRRIGYLIDEDGFGLDLILVSVGFSFFHDLKGSKGRLMNPMIKIQQRRNRLAALRSLKLYAEERHLLQSQE